MLMVNLLIAVTIGSSVIGLYLLKEHYSTEEQRHEAEAHGRLNQAANAIGNQVRFYQGIVDLLVSRSSTADLIAFSEPGETQQWSLRIRNLLPGAFGAALADHHGEIIGDPLAQRIGPACQSDLHRFARGQSLNYPPFHLDVAGLEHFDLMGKVGSQDGEEGVLLISFHVHNLLQQLQEVLSSSDILILRTADGAEVGRVGNAELSHTVLSHTQLVPGTDWQLQLITRTSSGHNFYQQLIVFNLALVLLFALVVAYTTRRFSRLLNADMKTLHRRIASVLDGKFDKSENLPKVQELGSIMPEIDKLAQALLQQREELREQTLSDPLTGLRNRRYFDVVIGHIFEHSRRHSPAILLIIDLNRFKLVNDTLGHEGGDRQLKMLATHLRGNTRASDEVARLGGDEFAVILQDISYPGLDEFLDNFCRQFDRQISTRRHDQLPVDALTVSIGAAVIDAAYYPDVNEVIHTADLAMYRAKAADGKGSRYHIAAYHP